MPVKVILEKWLCEHCRQLFDTRLECGLHERERHAALQEQVAWHSLENEGMSK